MNNKEILTELKNYKVILEFLKDEQEKAVENTKKEKDNVKVKKLVRKFYGKKLSY